MNRYRTYYVKRIQFLLLCIAGSVCCSVSSLGSCSILYYLYDAKFPWLEKGTCIIDFNGTLLDNNTPECCIFKWSETQSNLLCSQLCSYYIITTQTRIHFLPNLTCLYKKKKMHPSLKNKKVNTPPPRFFFRLV